MRKAFAVMSLSVVMLLAGCGGSDNASKKENLDPAQIVLASASKTAESKSSKMTMNIAAPGAVGNITADGAFDYATGRGSMTMRIPEIAGQKIGDIEVVLDGDVFYYKFSAEMMAQLGSQLGNKTWVKIDKEALSKFSGVDFSSLTQGQSGNPADALAILQGSGVTTEVGKETLRGDNVTHYKTTLDLSKIQTSATATAAQKKVIEEMKKTYSGDNLPADVWVDGANRLRKLSYEMDLSKLKTGDTSSPTTGVMTMAFELYDFGTDVAVNIPAASDTADLAALLSQAQAGSSGSATGGSAIQ